MPLRTVSNDLFTTPIESTVKTYLFEDATDVTVSNKFSTTGSAGHTLSSAQSVTLPVEGVIQVMGVGHLYGTGSTECYLCFGLYDGTNWIWDEVDFNGLSTMNARGNLKTSNGGADHTKGVFKSEFISIAQSGMPTGTPINLQPAAILYPSSVDNGIVKGASTRTTRLFVTVYDFS